MFNIFIRVIFLLRYTCRARDNFYYVETQSKLAINENRITYIDKKLYGHVS